MADLSKVLGDVYGGSASSGPATPPDADDSLGSEVRPGSPSVPAWADDTRLDEAFANWNPGPGPDAHAAEREMFVSATRSIPLDDDLAAALSEALADAPVAVPQPAAALPAPPPDLPEPTVRPSQTAAWLADVIRPDEPRSTRVVEPAPEPQSSDDSTLHAPTVAAPALEPMDLPYAPTAPVALRSWQRVDDDVLVSKAGRGGLRLGLRRR